MAGVSDLTPLISTTESRAHHYAGCAVQAFMVKSADGWGLHFGRMDFTDTAPNYPADVDYGWCRAVAEFLPVDRGIKALRSLSTTGTLAVAGTGLVLDGSPEMGPTYRGYRFPGFWPSDGAALGVRWPCNIALLRPPSDPQYSERSGPLVAKGAPVYPDLDAMVQHRAGIEVARTAYRNRMVVLVPNYQARISRVDHSVASLTIDVEARHVPPENLELKLYARADDVIQDHVDLANAKLPYRRQFPVRPAEWNVVLARKNDGTVIDYRHSYGVEKPTKVDLASLDSHRLTVIVAAGENTYREFKPFPYDDNGKRDVAETAVAFANTQGGVIFIGVRDDSTIEGVDRDGLEDTLVSSIRDRTDPPVEVTVHRVPVTGKFVYLVLVTPSTSRPHFLLKENVAYVRAASTDRRATRSEVYDMFRSERRGGLPGDLPWARST